MSAIPQACNARHAMACQNVASVVRVVCASALDAVRDSALSLAAIITGLRSLSAASFQPYWCIYFVICFQSAACRDAAGAIVSSSSSHYRPSVSLPRLIAMQPAGPSSICIGDQLHSRRLGLELGVWPGRKMTAVRVDGSVSRPIYTARRRAMSLTVSRRWKALAGQKIAFCRAASRR